MHHAASLLTRLQAAVTERRRARAEREAAARADLHARLTGRTITDVDGTWTDGGWRTLTIRFAGGGRLEIGPNITSDTAELEIETGSLASDTRR